MNRASIEDVAEVLLEYVANGSTHKSESVAHVPARNYTDPDRWKREIEQIFKRLPLMLAFSSEIAEAGDFKTLDVVDIPILLTRDNRGKAHAFINACSHRGGPVATEQSGKCARLTCRYHAWSYGLDGKLLGIADRQKFGDVDGENMGLKSLPCQEAAGMIFVCLSPGEQIEVESFYGDFLDDFKALDLGSWHLVGRETLEGANWKVSLDGYFEGYHFVPVHPVSISPYMYNNIMHYESYGPHMRIAFPAKNLNELQSLPRSEWAQREGNNFNFVRHMFPNVEVFIGRGLAQVAQVFPGPTPDRNRTVLNYFSKDKPASDEERAQSAEVVKVLSEAVRSEDYCLGLHIQKGLEAGALEMVTFGRNERGNQFFHEVIQWYLDGQVGKMPTIS